MKNVFTILLVTGIISCTEAIGQSAIGQLETISGGRVARSSSLSSATMSNMISGTILQSLFNSMLSGTASDQKELNAQQREAQLEQIKAAGMAAEQQKQKEAIAQAEYDKMMESYKLLDDSQDFTIKTIGNPALDFKSIDGDSEKLSSGSRKQFEQGSIEAADQGENSSTRFFGDAMPEEDLQLLLDIYNNPNIVDLRDANEYLDKKTALDSADIVTVLRKHESQTVGEPVVVKPDCIRLNEQLKGYINQREQFKKTIELSQNELNIWENVNNNAMLNAARDGLEYFTGELLQSISSRGKAADRLQSIYNAKSTQMAKDGVNIKDIQSKIDNLRSISSAGEMAEFTSNVNDWTSLVKNGISSLLLRLNESNSEINGILEDPMIKKYFETEKPELKTLLDISKLMSSNMVFGKWVAKKIPVIAVIELSIKQSYNGLDYLLSLNRIIEARKINGGVMDTAKYIQKNIDDTYLELTNCN